jgi:3-hydroxyisobutyrate dehydrogenase
LTIATEAAIVVGLGNLGGAMARRLIERGWSVGIRDRDPARVDELIAAGAARSLQIAAAKFICFVTPDDDAIVSTLRDGLLAELTAEHVVVVHSTILPEAAKRLEDLVADNGAGFIEAPVSGGADRARSGDLTVFVGGRSDAIDDAKPLLEAIGSQVFVMGPTGSASATKLANQLVLFASTASLHEALALTTTFGVEDAAVLRALESGLGDTWAGRNWGFFDQLSADYDAAGVAPEVRPWSKDPHEFIEAAEAAGTPADLARAVADVLPQFIDDHSRSAAGRKGRA